MTGWNGARTQSVTGHAGLQAMTTTLIFLDSFLPMRKFNGMLQISHGWY